MYTLFPHTADVGLRIEAADLSSLFAEAGRGMFSLIVANVNDVQPRVDKQFWIEGDDLEYLLFDWLNELLFTFERDKLVLSKFDVSICSRGLSATASGEVVDRGRHRLEHEIKAITYHGLRVEHVDHRWAAEVIVDI